MMSAEVIGAAAMAGVAAAARTVPGVADAAVVVRRRVRSAPPTAAPKAAPIVRDVPIVPDADVPMADLDGGPCDVPEDWPATLQEALRQAAELAPDKGTIFITKGNEDVLQTYRELLDSAERVLAGLRAAGLRPGDAALFQFADNRAYLTAFWACVLGGFVPTPVAVATTYTAPNEVNRKLRNAWHLLDRPVLLTDDATAGDLAAVRGLWGEPDVRILTVGELEGHEPDTDWFPATPDSPVLNLLTSGSTGVPKCVRHTNASVVARSWATIRHCGLTGDDVSLIWMPFDHVTVAMYNVRDVFLRCMHVNAKIDHFLSDPLLWLDWIDRYRATNTWAPNFAFAMVNERAAEIRERSWDLSCMREMVNAGEPVIVGTSRRFLELLAPHGLPADAMCPVWGMSETCSGVTYTRQHREDPTVGTVAIDPASLSGAIRYLEPDDEGAVVLSTVGRPIPGVHVRVVNEAGEVLPEGRMGELRIRGHTMMRGYFNNPEANRDAYTADGWFRTGDLAFVRNGEVVIAGRIKDQIIVRGINYMAHEIESVVERVDGIKVTFVAAAGVREPGAESDQLVIFFVPERGDAADLDTLAEEIRAILGREVGLAPDLLVPVTEAEFPKTGSGKIQRAALVKELRAGTFADRAIGGVREEPVPDTWFARRQWAEVPSPTAEPAPGVLLVFAEPDTLPHLRLPANAVVARRGAAFAEEGPGRFTVAATERTDLRSLLATVTAAYGPVETVVSALPLSLDGPPADRSAAVTAEVTALLAALADGEFGRPLTVVLTRGAVHAATGDHVDLGTCVLPGLVRSAVAELPTLPIRQVDLPVDKSEWAAALHVELADRGLTGVVAARDGRRWQPKLRPVVGEAELTAETVADALVPGGLYLVTGGLGGIATDLAGYLAADYGVRLLLVGRSPAEGERAERLAELTALGGQTMYHRLDVADADALEAAVAAAEQRWGRPLDGVLHLAGADPTGQWADLERHTVVNESAATFAAQYRAKVAGTLAIARVLESRPDAALVLFGSVNGEFGGHSFGAYSAANSFLAGFADHWHHERGRTVRCLAWSMWTGVGMNRGRPNEAARRRGYRPIEPAEGLRLTLDALALPYHYLVVGLDLANPAVVEELAPDDDLVVSEVVLAYTTAEDADPAAVRAALAPVVQGCPAPVRLVAASSIPRDAGGTVDTAQLLLEVAQGKPKRPFTPPRNELERHIATLWAEALNRPVIGRDDSFFDLGGNSLRATRLLALVDDRLAVRVAVQELYENPTVASMAAAISERMAPA